MDAAVLKIEDAPKLSKQQKREMADWLRNHADDLEREGHEYAEHFTGHFVIRSYAYGNDEH